MQIQQKIIGMSVGKYYYKSLEARHKERIVLVRSIRFPQSIYLLVRQVDFHQSVEHQFSKKV